ncbi:YetF domain-containing protein [Palleronia sp.]|uniref:YetF domain-containing protein n=1 Tax=Palleronia sp. TaxID=1940284 RepID=UPI0035C86608
MSDVTFFFGGWVPILRILVMGTLAYGALLALQRIFSSLQPFSDNGCEAPSVGSASPALLFYQGNWQRDAMRQERITEHELVGAVRQNGFGSLLDIEAIIMEANGKLAAVGKARAGDAGALLNDPR